MSGQHEQQTVGAPAPLEVAPAVASARLQWRVWGETAPVHRRLAAIGADSRTERRRDIYLLGTPPTHNAKVRGRRLEVNELLGVESGFQRWTRAVLHALPGHHHELAPVLDTLAAVPADELVAERLGRRRLLAAAVRRGLQPVAVTKYRQRYALGAMRAECTELSIDGTGIELCCVAIEGPDLAELIVLRERLGLAGESNLAVPEALRRALGAR